LIQWLLNNRFFEVGWYEFVVHHVTWFTTLRGTLHVCAQT
jgi:hypothetical protein